MAGGAELTRHVAAALAEARKASGRSLDEVAVAAGVHRTSLGLIERGKRGMTLDVAARLAWALDRSLADLIQAAEAALEPR